MNFPNDLELIFASKLQTFDIKHLCTYVTNLKGGIKIFYYKVYLKNSKKNIYLLRMLIIIKNIIKKYLLLSLQPYFLNLVMKIVFYLNVRTK